MTTWTKSDRLNAVFAGEQADRPPVSAYSHEIVSERAGADLAAGTLASVKKWDWDWIKLNPRTVHYAEAWGNEYDYDNYPIPGLPIPAQKKAVINTPEDLWKIDQLDIATNKFIQEQLDVIRKVKEGAPDTPVFATLYSPVNVFAKLAGIPSWPGDAFKVPGSSSNLSFRDFVKADRAGVHHALRIIAESLGRYGEAQKEAGAEGQVFVIATLTQSAFFSEAEFNEFSRPYDSIALDGGRGLYRVVHTCGADSHPQWFQDYPIEGINWDHEDPSNQDFAAPLRKVKVGGVSHLLIAKEPTADVLDKVRSQVREAREQTNDHLVLAPTCSISSETSDEALWAFKEAATE